VHVLPSWREIVRCNSFGPLYPLQLPPAQSLVPQVSSPLWHRHLGHHPGHEALSKLASSVSCPIQDCSELCHVCQLGRHVRLPSHESTSCAINKFDLIHCDLWTSLVVSISGYKYYLVILDNCTHYLWMLMVNFGTPNMFVTLWFGFNYGTNPPLGTLII
jgi:hypothetical protein